MLSSLQTHARQTVFLVWQSALTRKLIFPADMRHVLLSDKTSLSQAADSAIAAEQRFILIVSEAHFLETVELLKQKSRLRETVRAGIVVVAAEADVFLREKNYFSELLDVLSEKEARRALEFHLLRCVRQILLAEDRKNPRLGRKMLEQLNEIFISLSAERDPQRLLATILVKAMDLTVADGGTLYMVDERDGEFTFKLRISHDRTNEVMFEHIAQKVQENSVCGYVALTGKSVNVPDVSELRPLSVPQFSRTIDHNHEGRTHSLLTIPLKNGRNEITAVLQLANKHSDRQAEEGSTPSFEVEDESLLASFTTQAAICLENVDLYADIQRLFEGFIKASITAIESRDPSTGGHSERVAKLCVGLARATTDTNVGIYRSVKFKEEEVRELEYAALLHDFGKIGVREEVLVKAKKLYPYQLDAIKERIKICKAAAKIAYLEKGLKLGFDAGAEAEYQARLKEIDGFWGLIQAANEPNVLKNENRENLDKVANEQMLLPDGSHISVLSEEEYQALSVTQGSLTEMERLEIESHVRHTYQFLKMIPWTKDFKHLTEIAYCHHEKLDGSGYPRGLMSHEIPLQSKIMTIADIFDALTAADRWYKIAVPTDRALQIIAQEVAIGQIDPVLFEIFVETKIFELTQPKILTKVA